MNLFYHGTVPAERTISTSGKGANVNVEELISIRQS
jgi:hypothetical protein